MKYLTVHLLVAYCGLFRGACRKFLNDKCPGCRDDAKAAWCTVRTCNIERHYASCADYTEYRDVIDCKKFNNIIAKLFGLVFRSNRAACISRIKALGLQGHATEMARIGRQSMGR